MKAVDKPASAESSYPLLQAWIYVLINTIDDRSGFLRSRSNT